VPSYERNSQYRNRYQDASLRRDSEFGLQLFSGVSTSFRAT